MTDDDELLDVTDEERAAAEALRIGVEKAQKNPEGAKAGSDTAFVLALRASAGKGPPLDPAVEERAIEAALEASRRARRVRMWRPILVAAAVLLVAVPAASRLEAFLAPPAAERTSEAIFFAPFEETERASERADVLTRARTRGYFEGRLADVGGAR